MHQAVNSFIKSYKNTEICNVPDTSVNDASDRITVKDLDVERKRISLSIKEVQANPWKLALDRYPVGCIVNGSVRNITDFGIFVGLDEGIDGLVHVSDISWKQRECEPSEVASKGDEIEVKVMNIDVEQERLSLGIKQLTDDPWKDLDEKNPLGSEITGKVVNLTDFGIFIEVFDGVEGLVHISEVDSKIPKNKVHEKYPVGSEVQAKVIKIDLDERRLGLSITKVISTPEPVENEAAEEEKSTKGEKEKTDEKSVDSPEKAKEAAEVSEDSSSKADNEKEAAVKGKKKSAKKKAAEDVKEEESVQDAEKSVPEEAKETIKDEELDEPDADIELKEEVPPESNESADVLIKEEVSEDSDEIIENKNKDDNPTEEVTEQIEENADFETNYITETVADSKKSGTKEKPELEAEVESDA
jgi:ribosomal protein S1